MVFVLAIFPLKYGFIIAQSCMDFAENVSSGRYGIICLS